MLKRNEAKPQDGLTDTGANRNWSKVCAGVLSSPEGSHLQQGEPGDTEHPL